MKTKNRFFKHNGAIYSVTLTDKQNEEYRYQSQKERVPLSEILIDLWKKKKLKARKLTAKEREVIGLK